MVVWDSRGGQVESHRRFVTGRARVAERGQREEEEEGGVGRQSN